MDDKAIKSFMLTNVDRYIRVHFERWLVASFFDPIPVSLFFPVVFKNESRKTDRKEDTVLPCNFISNAESLGEGILSYKDLSPLFSSPHISL